MNNSLKSLLIPALRGLAVLGLAASAVAAQTKTYVVDAPGKLTTIAAQIQAAPAGGTHIVQFKTYTNVGTFSLTSLTADSLIFQRAEESAEVVEFSGTLFQLRNVAAAVVFRNLAFKLKTGSSVLLDGSAAISPNKNLLVDSCQLFGDSLNTTFFAWLGDDVSSQIEIKRSFFVSTSGSKKASSDLKANSIFITNCFFNVSGIFSASTQSILEFQNSTFNRLQFVLDGRNTSSLQAVKNIFGHPPSLSKLNGIGAKFIFDMSKFATVSTIQNVRFDNWAGYDYPSSTSFPAGQNSAMSQFGDSLELWNFTQATELVRGYQNPQGAFPSYNSFPGNLNYKTRLSTQDSVELAISSAQIPRVITASYATATYPALIDSTRSLWAKDTVLKVTGPTSVLSITFPQSKAHGTAILYSESGATYAPGTSGAEGAVVFSNALPAAKKFIPAFGDQNTPKGVQVAVKGLSVDTVLSFASVTRSGRTGFQVPVLGAGKKRWRVLQKGAKPFGFLDTTTAEGAGELKFGFTKTGTDQPFTSDSLSWLSGGALSAVTDSAGKYWGKTTVAASAQAVMIERLAIGAGRDTAQYSQGDIVTVSAKGHQLSVDSSFMPTVVKFPDMGFFSKGLSFKWPGRTEGDSLSVSLRRSSVSQSLFVLDSGKAIQIQDIKRTTQGSPIMSWTLAPADSNRIYFLGHRYMIAAGVQSSVILGQDTLKDIISLTPGDIALDTLPSLQGLVSDSLRILAKRRITQTGLSITGAYSAILQGLSPNRLPNIRVFAHRGARWDSLGGSYLGGFYRVSITPTDSVIVVAEVLEKLDTLPVIPVGKPTTGLVNGQLTITPALTTLEKTRLARYYVEASSIDPSGKIVVVVSKGMSGDSAFALRLNGSSMYTFRIGYESLSGKITWMDVAQVAQDPTGFITAAAAAARPYKPGVWELVGFPWAGNFKRDIADYVAVADTKDLEQFQWDGKWNRISGTADLIRGRGYLVGFPKSFAPKAAPNLSWSWAADTVLLDTGWQMISNPFPFPIADAAVGVDYGAVSYCYTLSWDGTGPNANPIWMPADTLKPFQGCAIHGKIKSKLIFKSPISPVTGPVGKRGIENPLAQIRILKSGHIQLSQLMLVPVSAPRPSPAPAFFKGGVVAHWDSSNGLQTKPLSKMEGLGATVILTTSVAQSVNVEGGEVESSSGEALALWEPTAQKLTLLIDRPEVKLAVGENTFLMVSVSPGQLEVMRESLIRAAPRAFELLGNYPNPFASETRIRFLIPLSVAAISHLEWEVRSLDGRVVYHSTMLNMTPGQHELTLTGTHWSSGRYILRATYVGDQGPKTLQQKLLHLEMGR